MRRKSDYGISASVKLEQKHHANEWRFSPDLSIQSQKIQRFGPWKREKERFEPLVCEKWPSEMGSLMRIAGIKITGHDWIHRLRTQKSECQFHANITTKYTKGKTHPALVNYLTPLKKHCHSSINIYEMSWRGSERKLRLSRLHTPSPLMWILPRTTFQLSFIYRDWRCNWNSD